MCCYDPNKHMAGPTAPVLIIQPVSKAWKVQREVIPWTLFLESGSCHWTSEDPKF